MENEIAQRATALGTLIEGLARREEFRGPRVARSEAGLTWGASGFVAALIRVAVVHSDAVSIDEAEAVVGAEKLRAMRDARYVRIRDGHVALRNELWRGGRPPEVDREAFSALREIIRDPDRQRLWISAELANAAYAAHAAAYPSTPPWTTLAVPPALTAKRYDDADGYDLGTVPSVGGSWLFTELERAAAQLWHEMLPQRDRSDDAGVLRRWLARVGGGAVDAARHLTNGARDRLLDAATRELLADPELGSLDEEMEWLLGPAYRADRELPTMSAEPTPAQIRLYWEDVERNRHCHVLDTSREHLHRLLALVMRHDARPFERVLEITEAGASKPYLVYFLGWSLAHNRPEAVAWLLSRTSTAALGVGLVATQDLAEPTIMDGYVARVNRVHSRRMMVMQEALPLFARTLADSEAADERRAVAMAIIDSLRGLARRAVRHTLADDGQQRLATTHAMTLYSAAVESLFTATTSRRVQRGGEPRASPALLLDECIVELVDALPTRPSKDDIIPWLSVAHTLLAFVRATLLAASTVATTDREEAHRRLVQRITEYYAQALRVDDDAKSFFYFPRDEALLEMRWEHLVCSLFETGGLDPWRRLVAVRAKLDAVDLATSPTDREARDVVAGCAARLRTHLEILARAYTALGEHRVAAHATREGARAELEAEIGRLALPIPLARGGD